MHTLNLHWGSSESFMSAKYNEEYVYNIQLFFVTVYDISQ